MTIILTPRTPAVPGDNETTYIGVTEMFLMVQKANHATAFPAWVTATVGMGLVIEVPAVRTAAYAPLLFAALLPILAAAGHVVLLLARAARGTAAAYEEFHRFIATTPPDAPEYSVPAWRQMQALSGAALRRDALTSRALTWAYLTGAAFLSWSAIALTIAAAR